MAYVVQAPLFGTVTAHIGVPKFEYYEILEYYSSRPKIGKTIWGAGEARQHEVLGFCIISYYSSEYDLVLLIDIYTGNCPDDWHYSEKNVFKRIIRKFKSIRKGKTK